MGSGSERVEDELHGEFPEAKIARLDRDTVAGKRQFEDILQNFRERNFDILVGTQMIAKGHDIPNVTLVGVVSADVGIGMPDFRAAERTFQILTQVAGRAGRGDLPGMVYMQTINPDHYAIRFAAQQDYAGFFEKELQFRRFMKYPPFAAMANVLVRAAKQEDALRMSTELGHHITPAPENMRIMGPAEAPVPRLKAEFRYQLLIKSGSRKDLNALLQKSAGFCARAEMERDRAGDRCRPADAAVTLVGSQQIEHVVGVLLFLRKNTLHHHPRGGVLIGEEANQFPVVFTGNALRDQVLFDHFDEIPAHGVLRCGAGCQSLGIEIGRSAELIDTLGDLPHMLLLFAGVFVEFRFHTFA